MTTIPEHEVVNDLYAFLAPCFLRRVTPALRYLSFDLGDGGSVVLEAIVRPDASAEELASLEESAAEARAKLADRLDFRLRREGGAFVSSWMRAWPLWSELAEDPP